MVKVLDRLKKVLTKRRALLELSAWLPVVVGST
jgi:hypothetical protein